MATVHTRERERRPNSDSAPTDQSNAADGPREVRQEVHRHQWSAYRYLERGPWTLSGILAFLGGLVFGVMGLVGLARAGFDMPLTSPVVTVGWLDQTAILAFGHVLLGLALAAVGSAAGRDRSGVLFLSGALVVVGLVFLIEPGAFADFLGATEAHGLTYALTGAVLLLAGIFAPTVSRNEHVITEQR
ncbi:MAG: hypothetical protein R3249_04130 [Nitriliruptorales bacterium]|nr:hypothetical protein [Nitriliruptorales bacterium]